MKKKEEEEEEEEEDEVEKVEAMVQSFAFENKADEKCKWS